MKRMLINATQEEELRMAMVDGQRLYDLNIEGPASERKKANIYKGKITRIEPSLEAAFVDYGSERHGFLPLKEISSEYFVGKFDGGKPNIREVLKEGQDIVIQIDKEERGNKGAALTTYISLAGRFIVLKPNKSRSGGVSRRIVGSDRDYARKSLNEIDVPDGMSVILRTAGIDRTPEELAWDLENLMKYWQAIKDHVLTKPAPFLLYRESNAVSRALRDYLTNDVGEILIDDLETYNEAVEQVTSLMPNNIKKLKHYDDPVPLFTRFQIETQIESAFAHSVTLPSGGSIVIDHTEALVSIDINSARATKGGDIEATALNTNLEAADEIARQLRIRDLGGLVVIDFIDMGPPKNQRDVENRLREAVRQDRARVQIGKITRFGLLEMSRQRLRPSIGESAYHTCPRCSGFGTIRSVESLALAILRIIGEEARKERTAKVIAQLPVEVATYLLNEKRGWVQSLEMSHDTQVVLVANSALETPHYDVRRVRDDQTDLPENAGVSYELADGEPEPEVPPSMQERQAAEQPAIGAITPTAPAPVPRRTGGLLAWLKGLFSGDGKKKKGKKKQSRTRKARQSNRGRNEQRGRQRGEQRQQGGGNRKRSKKKSAKSRDDRKKPREQQAQQDSAPKSDDDEQKRPSRNRRSRGGRRRRRSADRPAKDVAVETPQDNQETQATQPVDAAPAPAEAKPAAKKKAKSKRKTTKKTERKRAAPKKTAAPKSEPAAAPADDGPPRVRTDAERAADAVKDAVVEDTSKERVIRETPPAAEPVVIAAAEPAVRPVVSSGNGSSDDASAAAETPAPKAQTTSADKPAKPAAEEKKSEKPEGRLLPWEPAEDKPADPAD